MILKARFANMFCCCGLGFPGELAGGVAGELVSGDCGTIISYIIQLVVN
jgi:hypothetical protein